MTLTWSSTLNKASSASQVEALLGWWPSLLAHHCLPIYDYMKANFIDLSYLVLPGNFEFIFFKNNRHLLMIVTLAGPGLGPGGRCWHLVLLCGLLSQDAGGPGFLHVWVGEIIPSMMVNQSRSSIVSGSRWEICVKWDDCVCCIWPIRWLIWDTWQHLAWIRWWLKAIVVRKCMLKWFEYE